MNFDFTWQALTKPGLSVQYFDLTDIKEFDVNATGYNLINAWWLSEFSRLIYRHGKDENSDYPTREDILNNMGFSEVRTFLKGNNCCSLIISERDKSAPFAVLVFRGTTGVESWFSNFNMVQTQWTGGGLVHAGFRYDFLKLWDEVAAELALLDMPVFYTGHSLGGALATLAASERPPKALYSFGSPKVGDAVFADSLRRIELHRVVNNQDIIPTVPPSMIPFDYCHAGEAHILCSSIGYLSANSVPQFLADHAPVNYTAGLERLL